MSKHTLSEVEDYDGNIIKLGEIFVIKTSIANNPRYNFCKLKKVEKNKKITFDVLETCTIDSYSDGTYSCDKVKYVDKKLYTDHAILKRGRDAHIGYYRYNKKDAYLYKYDEKDEYKHESYY